MTLWVGCFVDVAITAIGWVEMVRLSDAAAEFGDSHCYFGSAAAADLDGASISGPDWVGGMLLPIKVEEEETLLEIEREGSYMSDFVGSSQQRH
ncbi:hypothetical protein ACLOJK_023105 [Asimina triloba]